MTEEERANDRAIIDAATEGPWVVRGVGGIYMTGKSGAYEVERMAHPWRLYPREEDAAFVAAARTRWPAALDENDRLRAALAALEEFREAEIEWSTAASSKQATDPAVRRLNTAWSAYQTAKAALES